MNKTHLKKRHRAEWRFRLYGRAAIIFASLVLVLLIGGITRSALPAFTHHYIALDITLAEDLVAEKRWRKMTRTALYALFPDVTQSTDRRALGRLLSVGAPQSLRRTVEANPALIGTRTRIFLPSSDTLDLVVKGHIDRSLPESERVVSDRALAWIDALVAQNRIERRIARLFFFGTDSREPELAGIAGALKGSLLTIFVTLLFSFPIGVMAAIYLQELAPKNRATDIIDVTINNLAAVPSIVFGLLGLAVFINFANLPRSAPLVGGLVLALMTLPTIIIATRAALAAVPPSIREAALGIGASRMQLVLHHVLPLALPGILTGTIIGLARAAGETAPLLMIGMMAFIVDAPEGLTDKATVLPAQIYMWANNPERAFEARSSAAIIVLLIFLMLVNATAILLRKRFERKW